jgi:hypothetical protein
MVSFHWLDMVLLVMVTMLIVQGSECLCSWVLVAALLFAC